MSHVHRLHVSDRIFFVTVNLRRALPPLAETEYELLTEAFEESRQKLHYLFLVYVLIWPVYPLSISRVIQAIKWSSSRSVNHARQTMGTVGQHQF